MQKNEGVNLRPSAVKLTENRSYFTTKKRNLELTSGRRGYGFRDNLSHLPQVVSSPLSSVFLTFSSCFTFYGIPVFELRVAWTDAELSNLRGVLKAGSNASADGKVS